MNDQQQSRADALTDEHIATLKLAARAVTPQDIDGAERIESRPDGSYITCPACEGEGCIPFESDYCNYDHVSIGVQFYGVGTEPGAAETYFRAAKPATILALLDRLERAESALAASPVEQPALLTAQDALAAIETFEIVGDNNDSREPNAEDRFILTEFVAHLFGGFRVELPAAAPADDACKRCGSTTAQACNDAGCFYLESGDGEPSAAQADERAECIAWAIANGFTKYHESMCAAWEERARRAAASAAPADVRAAFDILAHLQRQREFSERTFGPGARTAGVCDHIRKELKEIEANPVDLTEWIDVVILALDGAWRAGGSPQQIIDAIVAKQTKNEGRTWPDWRTVPADKAIEHDRSQDACQQCHGKGAVVFRDPEDAFDVTCGVCGGSGQARAAASPAAEAVALTDEGIIQLFEEKADVDLEVYHGIAASTVLSFARALLAAPQPAQADAPAEARAKSISDEMMDLADRLGSEWKDVDPRAWQHLLVYAPAEAFPYQKTFNAIAAATSVEGGHVSISVKAFRDAFGGAVAEAREPIAWVTDDDRAITAAQKQRALADGGATASSVRPYSIPCYAVSAPADAGEARLTDAARDMLAERRRQVEAEGWTPEHDDQYQHGAIALAAACYAANAGGVAWADPLPSFWPWMHNWWKPTTPRRDLVKAGALILAELERLDRAALLNGADHDQ